MEAQFDRLRYEVFQNLFLSPMNTGLLRPAVATAPTVYGIETPHSGQSYSRILVVATAPTVYGIETKFCTSDNRCNDNVLLQQHLPFTVLKHIEFAVTFW